MLADHLRTVFFRFDLIVDLSKQIAYHGPAVKIAENLCGCSLIFRLKGNSVNAKDIILERSAGNRLLRMLQIGRDDDQIPCLNGTDIPVKEEISFALQDKEDFCERMGVQYAGPVFLIFRQRDRQQPGICSCYIVFLNGIMSVTHKVFSF